MKPDLLLLDVMMPGMSGIDLLGMVRAVPALEYLPVVMLTGVMDLEIQSQAFKLGATDYIVKDFDWEKSLGRIEQHLRKN
jgi:DNA-binding response OmpR family regulator